MKQLKAQFEKTFADLWPGFNFVKRAVSIKPDVLEKEMHTYQVDRKVAKPTVTSPPVSMTPTRKMSSESDLSYSKFNLNNEIKVISNPAKVTGGPKDHDDDGNDIDKPQPEVKVIADPGNPLNPQPLPGNEPEEIIYTDVASQDGTVTRIAFMLKPKSPNQLEEPQPQPLPEA
jgi:hypothetical protein